MKRGYILYIAALVAVQGLLSSCQAKKEGSDNASGTAEETTYPQLSREEFMQLYNTADQVDIMFFHHPVSVSQDDPGSVRNTTLYISPQTPAQVSSRCKALGRISWMAQGTIIFDADVYMEDGCRYLLFMKGNKAVAAHAMADSGVEFFNNILTQVKQRTGK